MLKSKEFRIQNLKQKTIVGAKLFYAAITTTDIEETLSG